MVMRPGTYQANCNAGEIDPAARGNTGLKQYYSGLARAENVQPIPQGGFKLLPRTRFAADLGLATGEARLHAFTVDRDHAYVVALTGGLATIFKDGVEVGSLVVPWSDAEVPLVKTIQRQESMFLFHPDHAPRRILRHGSDTVWTIDTVVWSSVPEVDLGGTYTNTDEKWTIRLGWTEGTVFIGASGFTLSVDGVATSMVNFVVAGGGLDLAAIAANIQTALEDHPALDPGLVVVVGSAFSTYWTEFEVTFSGGRNSGENWTISGAAALDVTISVNTTRTVRGRKGGEAIMSATRGWPRCAAWYQDRMLPAGFKAKSSAFAASRTGEYFDLNIELNADSGGMLINLDTDGGEEIIHLIQGQYLGIFTNVAEYHLADRALKRNTPPNVVRSSMNGASPRVPPIVQENSILYVSREETVVYAATYDAVSTSFQSTPLSVLSSHLIDGVRGAALQTAQHATDAQRYFLPRDDGVMVIACLIRNQDVSPFVRWTTAGAVHAVVVDGANRVALLVDRVVGAETRRFLEIMDDDLLFDAVVTRTLAEPATLIDGLDAHEGATVWADVDGWIEGPFVVAEGTITLPHAGSVVRVGRWTPPVVETLPLVRDLGGRQVLRRPARVHTVQVDVIDTTSIAVGANGRPASDVALARFGDPADQPFAGRDGEVVKTGLAGFSVAGQVTISQARPGRLQVRDVTIQARV